MKRVLSKRYLHSRFICVFTSAFILILLSEFVHADSIYIDLDQSAVNLVASGVYTSSVFQSQDFKTVNVNVSSDVDSEADGLEINYVNIDGDCADFTPTSSNMDYTANGSGWTYSAPQKASYESLVRGNCAWVTYTNGETPQSSFKLTIFGNLK